jgi:hypothetical protein
MKLMLATFRQFLAIYIGFLQLYPVGAAQNPPAPPLTSAEQRIKDRVSEIAIGGKLTVRKVDGREYHGRLQSVDNRDFSLREVDLQTTVTVPYIEVDRVSKDYGGRGFGGRRVNPKRARIIGIVFVAALLTIVVVAVANDKS